MITPIARAVVRNTYRINYQILGTGIYVLNLNDAFKVGKQRHS